MKKNLNKTAALFIIAALLVIFLSTAISITFLEKYKRDINAQPVFNSFRILINPVMDNIKDNYSMINDQDAMNSLLGPELDEIGAHLKIINFDGTIIFDSDKNTPSDRLYTENIEYSLHYYTDSRNGSMNYVKFAFPVVVKGVQKGNALFTLPINKVYTPAQSFSIYLLPLGAGITLTVFILTAFYFYLSRNIFKPLRILNNAVPEIIKGNLDVKLKNFDNTEIGSFIRAFELMCMELKQSLTVKDDLERERKELTASISHDIKTPLASIKAYAEGLRDGIADSPAAADKYTNVIISKTDGLIKLVNDLLQHSIQDLGVLEINLKEQYSRQLFTGIIEPLSLKLVSSSLKLKLENEIPDVLIKADASRLEQVIANLVQNSEKYSSGIGEIVINTVLEDDCLLFSISDNGKGIPPEELPFIFDRYYRGSGLKQSNIEGSGLGLSICKYIIEKHGGIIFAESTPDKGSVFRFTIPKI